MKDLIERLEKATGPDRELDAMIVVALDLRPEWCPKDGSLWIDIEAMPADPPIRYAWRGRKSKGNPPIGHYAHFTASIDAALALVPEDHRWMVFNPGFDEGVYQDGKSGADIHHPLSSGGGPRWKGFGANPAIALCIAALKARLSLARSATAIDIAGGCQSPGAGSVTSGQQEAKR